MAQDIPLKQVAKKAVYLAEKNAIVQALLKSSGNKSKASRMLKIDCKLLPAEAGSFGIGWKPTKAHHRS